MVTACFTEYKKLPYLILNSVPIGFKAHFEFFPLNEKSLIFWHRTYTLIFIGRK